MNNDIKCPMCNTNLEVLVGGANALLGCPRCMYKATDGVWHELIRTRKALDVAKDAIDVISLKYHKDTPSIFLIKYAENAKAEITELEQKDVK